MGLCHNQWKRLSYAEKPLLGWQETAVTLLGMAAGMLLVHTTSGIQPTSTVSHVSFSQSG